MSNILRVIAVACAMTGGGSAHALEPSGGDLSFRLGLTFSDTDNIAHLSGAGVSSDDDTSIMLRAGASYKRRIGDSGRLSVDYNFSATRYDEIGTRDNNLHVGTAAYTHRFGASVLGASVSRASYQLAGDDFLDLDVANLFFGTPGPWGWVLVGRFTATEKSFESALSERDAQARTVGISASRRFGDTRIQLEISQTGEDARADFLDHNSFQISARLTQPLRIFDQPLTLSLSTRYSEREYDGFDPFYWIDRRDERRRFGATLAREFDSGLSIEAGVNHLDSSSNMPSADYDQTIVSFSINQRF